MPIETIKILEEKLYIQYMIELSRKFRFELNKYHINEFVKDLRRTIIEYDFIVDEYCTLMFSEFKKLFDAYDNGEIAYYDLPEVEYFITEEQHGYIIEEAIKLREKGEI